jgi:diaminopimelate decarboxylase
MPAFSGYPKFQNMRIPDPETIKTPFYLYDLDLLDATLKEAAFQASRYGFRIHYATKANYDPRILERIKKAGFGVDCVSGNEVNFAIEKGFKPGNIVFAGVGKTDPEIEGAILGNILCLNIESLEELEVAGLIAERLKRVAPVVLRVNPDIPSLTHDYIATGKKENKFGIAMEQLSVALSFCENHPWIHFLGLHFHIGSQITSLKPYQELCEAATHIWHDHSITLRGGRLINLGGGLGIDYLEPYRNPIPDFDAFFKLFHERLKLPATIDRHFELGRSLTGQCGSLITRVIYVKEGSGKRHVIVDAGMTELIRPALYGAKHKIENLTSCEGVETYDVVGPICESSDFFGKEIELPETRRNDLLKIHSCGAYAESMSMNYNLRGPIEKVYLDSHSFLNATGVLPIKRFITSSLTVPEKV